MQANNPIVPTGIRPYSNEAINKIYNQLFCDSIKLYDTPTLKDTYPWKVLLDDQPSTDQLKAIAEDETKETRPRTLAFNLLAGKGIAAAKKELLGVIVEVAMPGGLDVLAAFKDGTARYINYIEKMLIWETQTPGSDKLIRQLFSDSQVVVEQIGPWNQARRPFPVKDMVRISFLVSDGLYFGEATFDLFQKEPLAGPVIASASALMTFLIDASLATNA